MPRKIGRYWGGLVMLGIVWAVPMLGDPALAAPRASQAASHATIREFSLPNGLRVVVMPQAGASLVSHTLWYRVGASDDPAGKTGLAHFLEHMMFQGTKAHPAGTYFKTISALGGEKNAFTSQDVTAYYVSIARKDLPTIMALEADRMQHMEPLPPAFIKEREVILEERRQQVDTDPSGRLHEEIDAALFLNHPYHRPVIGWAQEMEALTRADVLAFHKAHYAPNNALLVLAGDITEADARNLAAKYYGAVPKRAIAPRTSLAEPKSRGIVAIRYEDQQVQQPAFQQRWVVPSMGQGGSAAAAKQYMLATILGEGNSSRLFRALVMQQKIATQAGISYQGLVQGPGRQMLFVTPSQAVMRDHAEDWQQRIERAVDAELKQLAEHGPTDAEMARGRMGLRSAAIYAQDSVQGAAQLLGQLRMLGLPADYLQQWPNDIGAVTAADVQAAARALLKARSVRAWLLPAPKESPDATTK